VRRDKVCRLEPDPRRAGQERQDRDNRENDRISIMAGLAFLHKALKSISVALNFTGKTTLEGQKVEIWAFCEGRIELWKM
jgi:hypothetical protein